MKNLIPCGCLLVATLLVATASAVAQTNAVRGDLDGDGYGDVVLMENGGTPFISYMTGLTEVASSYPMGTNTDIRPWSFVATGHFDTNGVEEMIFRYDTNCVFAVGELVTGTITEITFLEVDGSTDLAPWQLVAAGDVNGDRKSEVVMRYGDEGIYAIGYLGGMVITNSEFLFGEESDISPWRIEAAGDLNGDGRAELIGRRSGDHVFAVAYLATNGYDVTTSAYLLGAETDVSPWSLSAVTDLFGDTICDLIFRQDGSDYYALATMSNVYVTGGTYLELDPEAEPSDIVGPR